MRIKVVAYYPILVSSMLKIQHTFNIQVPNDLSRYIYLTSNSNMTQTTGDAKPATIVEPPIEQLSYNVTCTKCQRPVGNGEKCTFCGQTT
jgi:hypothetical protein